MVYHNINLDLSIPRGVETIYIKSGSSGHYLKVSFKSNNSPYMISEHPVANILLSSDYNLEGVAATSVNGSTAIFSLDNLYSSGWTTLQITIIIDANSTIVTQSFQLFCEDQPDARSLFGTGGFTAIERTKLAGVAEGAEVNVQPDWEETDTTADAFIKNKPTIPEPYTLPEASSSTLGGVKVDGTSITITDGIISATNPPVATAEEVGTVRVDGNTINIDGNGVISSYRPTKYTIQLLVSQWDENACTVSVSGAHINTDSTIIVSPVPASLNSYAECGVYCSEISAPNTLVFCCNSTPAINLSVNIIVL